MLIEVHKLKEGAMPCIHGQMICDGEAQFLYSIPGAEYTMKNEGHFSDASLADKFFGNLRPPKASCKKSAFYNVLEKRSISPLKTDLLKSRK